MIGIDILSYQSKLRYVNPMMKFTYAMCTLALCVCTRWVPIALVVLVANSYLIVVASGVKVGRYLHYLEVPVTFLLLSTASIILNISKAPLDLWASPVGDWYVSVSVASLSFGLQLLLTAFASVTCLYFLSFTTPMPDILWVLGKLKCPPLVIELMLLIYRYIFVLMAVANDIGVAQASRLGQRDYKTAIKSFVALVSVLFIRAMKKSNALYDAMEARCYDGTLRVLHETVAVKTGQAMAVAVFEIGLLVWYFLARGVW